MRDFGRVYIPSPAKPKKKLYQRLEGTTKDKDQQDGFGTELKLGGAALRGDAGR